MVRKNRSARAARRRAGFPEYAWRGWNDPTWQAAQGRRRVAAAPWSRPEPRTTP
jgi:hypothetical protein